MRVGALLFLILLSAGAVSAETVNSAVGQVGDHVVTSREVWISNFLERWTLASRSTDASVKSPKPDWKPALKSDAFNQAASNLLLEIMVAQEAENFSIAQIEDGNLKHEVSEVQKAMTGSTDWAHLEVSNELLEKFIARKHRAQNFLKFKTESAGVAISDEEAKSYFEKNRLKFGHLPFAQFKESIKEVLSRQMLEERLKDWFEVLRRKYRVRFLGSQAA